MSDVLFVVNHNLILVKWYADLNILDLFLIFNVLRLIIVYYFSLAEFFSSIVCVCVCMYIYIHSMLLYSLIVINMIISISCKIFMEK
jgi:hypothetical protein